MAYETKVILTLLAEAIARTNSAKEAYGCVVRAASVEGIKLPTFTELREMQKQEAEKD